MLFRAIEPMLLTSHKVIPISLTDQRMLYEAKYDGWRILIHKEDERIDVFTRGGMNVTRAFPEFQSLAPQIQARTAILDGEGICLDASGNRPVLERFSARAQLRQPFRIMAKAKQSPVSFMCFDILYASGESVASRTLLERKQLLTNLINVNAHIQVSPYTIGDGRGLFDWTKENHWEGIVAKVVKGSQSRYIVGHRSTSWIKWKHRKQIQCSIVGYAIRPFRIFVTESKGPVTMVEYGFNPEEKRALMNVAKQLHKDRIGSVQWLMPGFSCWIEFLEHTESGHLRDAVFRGFVLQDMSPSTMKLREMGKIE
ncbi:ATP-dependent DNA ligase [Paenibacillus mendelii]|uniref:DNA ligase n=1 Tax=Paenibacillus mendelii TaxID=206163 RepID=A0ABV6JBL9_9BACL|nr:DNA ligase [Paenibacillus mendelii]MCQ6563871.1 DNA ligase [Paenibacillus mendelii]